MSRPRPSKYEHARIVGARSVQIAMGAPVLVAGVGALDPVSLAEAEHDAGVCPITVHTPPASTGVRG